jgi:hypothetical protein
MCFERAILTSRVWAGGRLKGAALAALAVALYGAETASADVVTEWNEAALGAIRSNNSPPPMAARNLAMVHLAMFDAVNGILRTHEPYRGGGDAPLHASSEAAASAAAHDVLSALYPGMTAEFEARKSDMLSSIPDGAYEDDGLAWGSRAAARILADREGDGSGTVVAWPDSDEAGQWRPTDSFNGQVLPALLPAWGKLKPFALRSGSQFRPPAPPALKTGRYAWEVNQVKDLGAGNSVERTVDQTEIALFWGYGPRTSTPAGHWNEVAQAVAAAEGNSLAENARLFALVNMAMADAAIVSWDAKYAFNLWRPITAVRLADTDGNRQTAPDPAWTPLLPTPPFPEYTSGHSTFSGAAAITLALFYGRDDVPFSVSSEDMPGVYRFYEGFWEAALESGMSRIYGGIHFMSGNRHGLLTGVRTGSYVFRHYLQAIRRKCEFEGNYRCHGRASRLSESMEARRATLRE